MNIVKITPDIAVSEQILPEDVAAIAAAGYKVLINNRPDGEAPGQPSSAAFAAAAAQHGVSYVYYPVTGLDFPGSDLEQLSAAFAAAKGPALAFCRSGTRSINLWLATRSAQEWPEALQRARSLGYDLSMVGQR
ncbi:TIGR01244 family sulfur transferase [Haliea sp. E1-2-M8]|uniref:TIGR01244 family sulfur transferase n=1 Tax=Haliea sp. E1-2-M8 TaxID=3064706 RepID=UPI002726A04F|nr:TIGR01244 family sulfur transferase [Haliea sp. E1-2-M8]MDO8860788.1 TIGR01244 family sulfur transferase [Haliea sp. E1-2-M8]